MANRASDIPGGVADGAIGAYATALRCHKARCKLAPFDMVLFSRKVDSAGHIPCTMRGVTRDKSTRGNIMDKVLSLQMIETTGPEPLAEMAGSLASHGCDAPTPSP